MKNSLSRLWNRIKNGKDGVPVSPLRASIRTFAGGYLIYLAIKNAIDSIGQNMDTGKLAVMLLFSLIFIVFGIVFALIGVFDFLRNSSSSEQYKEISENETEEDDNN